MRELSHTVLSHINYKTLTEVKTEFKKKSQRMLFDCNEMYNLLEPSPVGLYIPNQLVVDIENVNLSYHRVIPSGSRVGGVKVNSIQDLNYPEWHKDSKYVKYIPIYGNYFPSISAYDLTASEDVIVYWLKTVPQQLINGVPTHHKFVGTVNPTRIYLGGSGSFTKWVFFNIQLRIPLSVYNKELDELIKYYKVLSKS